MELQLHMLKKNYSVCEFYCVSPVMRTLSVIMCKPKRIQQRKKTPFTLNPLWPHNGSRSLPSPQLLSVAELQSRSRPVMYPRWPPIWPSPLGEHLLITRLGCWLELQWAPRSSLPMLTARVKRLRSSVKWRGSRWPLAGGQMFLSAHLQRFIITDVHK